MTRPRTKWIFLIGLLSLPLPWGKFLFLINFSLTTMVVRTWTITTLTARRPVCGAECQEVWPRRNASRFGEAEGPEDHQESIKVDFFFYFNILLMGNLK